MGGPVPLDGHDATNSEGASVGTKQKNPDSENSADGVQGDEGARGVGPDSRLVWEAGLARRSGLAAGGAALGDGLREGVPVGGPRLPFRLFLSIPDPSPPRSRPSGW